jgi:hypothetical protein
VRRGLLALLLLACAAGCGKSGLPPDPEQAVFRGYLKGNSSEHGGVARWAHQFMTGGEALHMATQAGYRCEQPPRREGLWPVRCVAAKRDVALGEERLELRIEDGMLRGARGFRSWVGTRTYGEVAAPGIEFRDPQAFAALIAGRFNPIRTYGEITRQLEQLGLQCRIAEATESEARLRCPTQSFSGQKQELVLPVSLEDTVIRRLEARVGDAAGAVEIPGIPQRKDGDYAVLVRNQSGQWQLLNLPWRWSGPTRDEKFVAGVAALDAPSRLRVLRAVRQQIDEYFGAESDASLSPLLTQLDYAALRLRRLGDGIVYNGHAVAAGAHPNTYASFALAECDGKELAQARACLAGYTEARAELKTVLNAALAETEPFARLLEADHPAALRISRLRSAAAAP